MKRTRREPQRRKKRAVPHPSVITQALATLPSPVERALIQGDLSSLSADERVSYYRAVCHSLGLNPLTRPFDYLTLNNRLVLYARRDCTDQLRQSRNVRIEIIERSEQNGLYVVRARASMPSGRSDESLGAVAVKGQSGLELANSLMKAETKAKRRATLSICGLGMLDETEIEDLKDGQFPALAGAPALRAEDVMPRRKPGIENLGRNLVESMPDTEQGPVQTAGERKGSPAADRAEPKAAGVLTPVEPHVGTIVEINGRQIATAGITKLTLLKAYKMSTQLDELTGKGQAKELLGREFGVEHRAELTEEIGQKYVAALAKLVNKALQQRPS